MKIAKSGWCVECRRGLWFAVDRATKRRIRCRGREHAANLAADNNRRIGVGLAKFSAVTLWGA